MTTVVSGALWACGTAIIVVGLVTAMYGVPAVGIVFCMAGSVLNVRRFVLRCEERMRDVFECGREYERSRVSGEVHSLR